MKRRKLSEMVELMQPATVEVFGEDCMVGPDVVTDNRNVTPGAAFVAIAGERVDGHDFASAAQQAGASLVIATRVTEATIPHLLGEDSVQTLSWLARAVVKEARGNGMLSIGVTGSSGKTSTKDLIAQVLETAGETVSPVGSQNNEIGVPLTACRVAPDTKYLVSELGARGPGHISWLTSLVPLDVAVVLNVGQAHAGEFGGIEATQRAKAEIVAELSPAGWAVLNADDERVSAMAKDTKAQLAWFGVGELPQGKFGVRARDIQLDELSRPGFVLEIVDEAGKRCANVQLKVVGRHQVGNALAAAAVGIIAGIDLATLARALNQAEARSQWRMALTRLPNNAIVVNDAYNANPDSMSAALHTAAQLRDSARSSYPNAKLIGVLGDMLELGETAKQAHHDVGELAAELGFDQVIGVGQHGQDIVSGAVCVSSARVATRDEAVSSLRVDAGDVVLIKGSRAVGLEQVAAALEEKQ